MDEKDILCWLADMQYEIMLQKANIRIQVSSMPTQALILSAVC